MHIRRANVKFKVKIVLTEIKELDTDWYPGCTMPEECIALEQHRLAAGNVDLSEFFGDEGFDVVIERL